MIFKKTKIDNALVIEPEKIKDKRGFFSTTWDYKIFKQNKLNYNIAECNTSFNKKKGTLRGLHYQIKPYEEVKLIRCTKGKIFDVVVDLRPKSKTFLHWYGVILSSQNHKMNYVPKGCAHGFQTLENNTEVFYQMSQLYKPKFSRGVRWDDKKIKIKWPLKPTIISDKDSSWKMLDDSGLK